MAVNRQSVRWLAAELVVIVLGILIAYQVESWRDMRADRERVRAGVTALLTAMEAAAREDSLFAARAYAEADAVMALVAHLRSPRRDPDTVTALFPQAVLGRNYNQNSRPWFSALQENGTLDLVDDAELKRDLTGFHDGYLSYLDGLIGQLSDFQERLVEASLPDLAPLPRETEDGDGTLSFDFVLQRPVEEIPSDPAFVSALGWVARRATFGAGRVLRGREQNLALQERIRAYLDGL